MVVAYIVPSGRALQVTLNSVSALIGVEVARPVEVPVPSRICPGAYTEHSVVPTLAHQSIVVELALTLFGFATSTTTGFVVVEAVPGVGAGVVVGVTDFVADGDGAPVRPSAFISDPSRLPIPLAPPAGLPEPDCGAGDGDGPDCDCCCAGGRVPWPL